MALMTTALHLAELSRQHILFVDEVHGSAEFRHVTTNNLFATLTQGGVSI